MWCVLDYEARTGSHSVSPSDVERILAGQAANTDRILAAIAELRREASGLGERLLPQLIEELLRRPR